MVGLSPGPFLNSIKNLSDPFLKSCGLMDEWMDGKT
jgi:hypothetical protein